MAGYPGPTGVVGTNAFVRVHSRALLGWKTQGFDFGSRRSRSPIGLRGSPLGRVEPSAVSRSVSRAMCSGIFEAGGFGGEVPPMLGAFTGCD